MTDTESTESIKDDVPDDVTNYVPSSQDDDYKAKQNNDNTSKNQDDEINQIKETAMRNDLQNGWN